MDGVETFNLIQFQRSCKTLFFSTVSTIFRSKWKLNVELKIVKPSSYMQEVCVAHQIYYRRPP